MQVFVKSETTSVLTVGRNTTGEQIKQRLGYQLGTALDTCYLSFGGRIVDDDATLESCGVRADCTLHLHARLPGGAKKRKKKTVSTPKKTKHLHEDVPQGMPKVYEMDESGNVQRQRKQCPKCGPGAYMATHVDRLYCGKCMRTFLYDGD